MNSSETPPLVLNTWEIRCKHTPETIDRIMINLRKRGMLVESLSYKKIDSEHALCIISFEDTPQSSERIFSNMLRIEDIISMQRI